MKTIWQTIEAYEVVSRNALGSNEFSSVNVATEMVGKLKSVLNERKSRLDEELTQKDKEHVLTMRELMGANCSQ